LGLDYETQRVEREEGHRVQALAAWQVDEATAAMDDGPSSNR